MNAATVALIQRLTHALGPPVSTPEWVMGEAGQLDRARYRVFRWRCPACGAGSDDPDLIWRPFVVDSKGRCWCDGPYCVGLAAAIRHVATEALVA